MKQFKTFFSLITAFFFICNTHAQEADFSGKWAINKSKIDFGGAPELVLPKAFNVEQNKKQVSVGRILLDENGNEHPFKETLSYNSKEVKNAVYTGSKRTSSMKWSDDKKSFVITSSAVSADGIPKGNYTESWSLENDGNTLVVDRHVEQSDGSKYTIKGYYEKQK